jgi:hypothetical protein
MRSAAATVLRDLSRAFAELGVRWYLFGAQAAIIYGSTRVTEDVDVTVELGARSPGELIGALTEHGLRSRVKDAAAFAARRVLPFVHDATAMPVDVLLAGPGLEELFLARVVRHTRERTTFPVACAEDIVVMKLLAGRPHDHEDILAILRAAGKTLDRPALEESLALLEDALGQCDLRPAFAQLVKRAARATPRRSTKRLSPRRRGE